MREVWVLRLSHRLIRDQRITSHLALVARAFGARGMYYSGEYDQQLLKTMREVVEKWGGEFELEHVRDPQAFVREWRKGGGEVIHLTMYGIPLPEVIEEVRRSGKRKLVVVGGEKVPAEYFELADWNISITTQPHSEVAALAVFLHELFSGGEFGLEFKNARVKIVPQRKGKKIVEF